MHAVEKWCVMDVDFFIRYTQVASYLMAGMLRSGRIEWWITGVLSWSCVVSKSVGGSTSMTI